ncbi:MAG: GGDEF domain-containing protein [Rhodoferax sp.]|uniref:GGDEF domain-containing protein n=1 Tax=Rhodoferax sp. TaxID=50421 RepID=UPI001817737C|nr:GGDEF domain-containing protein [Rhodoferax sp.]NMM14429.1 GGDEF domain-containing protein [Rhodoferax sp.]
MDVKKPFEIARETLKQLTVRKMAPTPANYQMIYSEVAGVATELPFPADRLRDIAQALPTKTPGQQKQRGLLDSAIRQLNWDGVKNALMAYGGFSPPADTSPFAGTQVSIAPPVETLSSTVNAPALTADFFEQIARLIEYALPALGTDDERFAEQTQLLLTAMRQPEPDVLAVKLMLSNFGNRLSFAAEDQAEIKVTLLKLLHLIIENIGELSLDDRWLTGQIEALMTASSPPLSLRRLDDVERRLKDVIFKQTEAKGRALEAQEEMRLMLSTFIERLSQMTESTSAYHGKMEENARLIEQAKTMADIAPVLKEVVGATRTMAHDSLTARDELRGMREKAQTTEAELVKLHQELDRVSALARHDPLTGALNRKGLDEALDREISNVRRKESPLCMAMLDIDNFKTLNDTLGHATGDAALTHLATVTREAMRPQDTLARYGGEEFVILLPDTPLDKGIEAMTRLQRELTKRFFLAGTEKILITFSAGVAQMAGNESGLETIKRADQAMYLAKRSGKNRVLGS